MNMKFAAIAAAGALSSGIAPKAAAADHGYIGAGITQTNFDIDLEADGEEVSGDADDNGYKLIVGYRPLDWFAVEASGDIRWPR